MPYVEYDEVEAVCAECGRIFRSEDALTLHKEETHQPAAPPPGVGRSRRSRTPVQPPADP